MQMGIVRIRVKIFASNPEPATKPVKPALAFVAPAPLDAPARRGMAASWPRASYGEAHRTARQRVLALGIVVLHLLGLWGLSEMQAVRRTVARVAPVVVRLVAPPDPTKPPPAPAAAAPRLRAPAPLLIDAPVIAIAAAPAPVAVVAAPLPPPSPAPAAATPAPTPPALKQVPPGAVRYLREPRMTVPLMSRRLKESGVVHLRVVVDVRGQPREITLAKSSGFARLDEQALQDMRSARFAPQTENGRPVEWEVIAPMSYEVDH